ncbi:hypothetical protein K493DRAFT_409427 [Basidiobolus meristosporus CBS 931.73]|uniref:Uncharacterized protein n=1 Tax=Basidiobolus meristosporus CBS 931.73 TaxID=1314790 RepID=A0A1Y1XZX9_9FUNG|nr:hypothetical protein K493DRAFT_409427 [Basidiobolus meristosporus CBS 931.73]|eukprot:ORX91215.1 hypothetical protein K493DRAFT_409427 [Basidiobolus meristosporus CBS 931.73]
MKGTQHSTLWLRGAHEVPRRKSLSELPTFDQLKDKPLPPPPPKFPILINESINVAPTTITGFDSISSQVKPLWLTAEDNFESLTSVSKPLDSLEIYRPQDLFRIEHNIRCPSDPYSAFLETAETESLSSTDEPSNNSLSRSYDSFRPPTCKNPPLQHTRSVPFDRFGSGDTFTRRKIRPSSLSWKPQLHSRSPSAETVHAKLTSSKDIFKKFSQIWESFPLSNKYHNAATQASFRKLGHTSDERVKTYKRRLNQLRKHRTEIHKWTQNVKARGHYSEYRLFDFASRSPPLDNSNTEQLKKVINDDSEFLSPPESGGREEISHANTMMPKQGVPTLCAVLRREGEVEHNNSKDTLHVVDDTNHIGSNSARAQAGLLSDQVTSGVVDSYPQKSPYKPLPIPPSSKSVFNRARRQLQVGQGRSVSTATSRLPTSQVADSPNPHKHAKSRRILGYDVIESQLYETDFKFLRPQFSHGIYGFEVDGMDFFWDFEPSISPSSLRANLKETTKLTVKQRPDESSAGGLAQLVLLKKVSDTPSSPLSFFIQGDPLRHEIMVQARGQKMYYFRTEKKIIGKKVTLYECSNNTPIYQVNSRKAFGYMEIVSKTSPVHLRFPYPHSGDGMYSFNADGARFVWDYRQDTYLKCYDTTDMSIVAELFWKDAPSNRSSYSSFSCTSIEDIHYANSFWTADSQKRHMEEVREKKCSLSRSSTLSSNTDATSWLTKSYSYHGASFNIRNDQERQNISVSISGLSGYTLVKESGLLGKKYSLYDDDSLTPLYHVRSHRILGYMEISSPKFLVNTHFPYPSRSRKSYPFQIAGMKYSWERDSDQNLKCYNSDMEIVAQIYFEDEMSNRSKHSLNGDEGDSFEISRLTAKLAIVPQPVFQVTHQTLLILTGLIMLKYLHWS